jgi:hypothetical protein
MFMPVGDVAEQHRESLHPCRKGIHDWFQQHAPTMLLKARLVLFPEQEYAEHRGRVVDVTNDCVEIFSDADRRITP